MLFEHIPPGGERLQRHIRFVFEKYRVDSLCATGGSPRKRARRSPDVVGLWQRDVQPSSCTSGTMRIECGGDHTLCHFVCSSASTVTASLRSSGGEPISTSLMKAWASRAPPCTAITIHVAHRPLTSDSSPGALQRPPPQRAQRRDERFPRAQALHGSAGLPWRPL